MRNPDSISRKLFECVGVLASLWERRLSIFPSSLSSRNQPRPQIMATEVVRLPPMLKVRNFFAFSI